MKKLVLLISMICCSASYAEIINPQWFADHKIVPAGETLSIPYKFPTPDSVIMCENDESDGMYAAIAWKNGDETYQTQIGAHIMFVISDAKSANAPMANYPLADDEGTIVVKNLKPKGSEGDQFELSCAYAIDDGKTLR